MQMSALVSAQILIGKTEVDPELCLSVQLPDGVTMGQLERVIVKFLEEHPAELHNTSTWLIQEALSDAFPCKNPVPPCSTASP